MTLHRNYAGEMVETPADFPIFVASVDSVVWTWKKTRRTELHQVRYGLQVRQFPTSEDAAHEFGLCVRHQAESAGLLDR